MKFTLTYDGPLSSSGNASSKSELKSRIRRQISPQLKLLWDTHPALKRVLRQRVIPGTGAFVMTDPHHSAVDRRPAPTDVPDGHIDLCASIPRGKILFRPLVRSSYALACTLDILFMRNEPIGRVYQGGDLDNRLKTLLDALAVPTQANEAEGASEEHLFCLLEDDALVTRLNVDTRRLLTRPEAPDNEVRLILDVTVIVTDARSYNTLFLGD